MRLVFRYDVHVGVERRRARRLDAACECDVQ